MNALHVVIAAGLLFVVWRSISDAGAVSADGEGGGLMDDAIASVAAMTGSGERNISWAGIDAIKRREGISLTVYRDAAGHLTIGYGHKVKLWENFDGGITETDATMLLASDLGDAVSAVNGLVDVPLSQAQFDALVSFVFNVGAGAFRSSTLLSLLNNGDYAGAADQFGRWVYVTSGGTKVVSSGLQYRRGDEARQFMA